jgi:hypothetical protein
MAAYMTGVKMNNEVISMTSDTVATARSLMPTATCWAQLRQQRQIRADPAGTGQGQGLSTGVVTTTRITTPRQPQPTRTSATAIWKTTSLRRLCRAPATTVRWAPMVWTSCWAAAVNSS